jgi:hypothetical protein
MARTMTNSDLWNQLHGAVAELRHRDQIAVAWWSLDHIDTEFDLLCKAFDPGKMEPHRRDFRKFALRNIGHFLASDFAFNNRVKRELRNWMKKHVDIAPTPVADDDTREFLEGLTGPTTATGKL